MWLPKWWNVDVIDPLELGRDYIHSLNRSELLKCWNVDVIDPLELGRGYIHSLKRSELDLDPRPLVLLPIV